LAIPPGYLVCVVTGEPRRDTSEEKVRQRFARSLMEEFGYQRRDIEIEFPINIGAPPKKRVDIAVFHPEAAHEQENIYLIVEVKKEKIKPSDKKEGIGQLKSYLAACASAKVGCWTNSSTERVPLEIFVKRDRAPEPFETLIELPYAGQDLDTVGQPEFSRQTPAVELRTVFRRCHNYVHGNQGLPKDKAFHEFLKVIFCKVWDEKFNESVHFYVTNQEAHAPDGQARAVRRLGELFSEVKGRYDYIFDNPEEKIVLEPRVAAYIMGQMQRYALLTTDTDVKGAAYEEIVGDNLRGDRGEFFTPRNVCNAAVGMVSTIFERSGHSMLKVKLIDPACGTGGFLISYVNFLRRTLHDQHLAKHNDPEAAEKFAEKELPGVCQQNLFGLDFNPILVRAAQMNELMHGDGSGNLHSVNSLVPPEDWSSEMRSKVDIGKFDALLTNPPFGTKIPVDDSRILGQYDLGHVWRRTANGWERTDRLRSSAPPEELFLERCVRFLKPGGIAAMIVPDRILSNPGTAWIRSWLLQNVTPIASVSLPRETFLPSTDEQTDILVFRRANSTTTTKMFTALVKSIGNNSRGEDVYRTGEDGEVIMRTMTRQSIRIERGRRLTEYVQEQEPVRADDLPEVTARFERGAWRRCLRRGRDGGGGPPGT
jgi:type I restriction enzyme M protein